MNGRESFMHLLPRALGGTAAILAAMAAVVGDPNPRRSRARLDVAALAGVIEREEDHVTALELAEWIRDRRPGLRIGDVRTRAEFDEYHIPSAERVALAEIAKLPANNNETWVLYSEGGAHAAQAWTLMRAMGHQRVYFLRGGILDWSEEVLNPVLPPAATPQVEQANAHVAELSRYFGGVPRTGALAEGDERTDGSSVVKRTRRRGC